MELHQSPYRLSRELTSLASLPLHFTVLFLRRLRTLLLSLHLLTLFHVHKVFLICHRSNHNIHFNRVELNDFSRLEAGLLREEQSDFLTQVLVHHLEEQRDFSTGRPLLHL